MTSKNNRAPLLYYIKLCASFQIHWWIQTGVTVWKRSIQGKIGDFLSQVTLKFDGWPWKTIGHFFYATLSFGHHFKAIGNSKLSYSLETLNSGQNWWFCVPCDLEIWQMTLKNNREPSLCWFKLCASFYSHQWILTGVTVRKYPIWVKIDDFFLTVWPWNLTWSSKAIGHLFYATSSFVHHFKAISKSKLKLQSGNAQFGSKSAIFCPVWPWNLADDLKQRQSEGFDSCDRPNNLHLDSNRQFFHLCDREIWWMTSKNNRTPLLCFCKLYASFRSHWWIQTGVTVPKRPIWVKFDDF